MYRRESIDLLKSIADPKDVLCNFGNVPYNYLKDNGTEIRCACPLHGGDRKDGFSWQKSTGVWTCFTHNCGAESGRDVYAFIMQVRGLSFLEAVEALAEQCGFQLEKGEINSYSSWEHASKAQKQHRNLNKNTVEKLEPLKELPGFYEDGWSHVFSYLVSRGYPSYEEIKDFNLYPCIDPANLLRLGFPAYDDEGNLVGVNCRRMDGVLQYPEVAPKYRITTGYKKANVLYNLNIAKNFCSGRELVLVEGELSCIRLHTYDIKNSAAMTGSQLSPAQAALACKYATSIVFLLEEGEAAALGTANSILEIHKLAPFIVPIYIAKLASGDADDNSKEAVIQALSNYRRLSKSDLDSLQSGDHSVIYGTS